MSAGLCYRAIAVETLKLLFLQGERRSLVGRLWLNKSLGRYGVGSVCVGQGECEGEKQEVGKMALLLMQVLRGVADVFGICEGLEWDFDWAFLLSFVGEGGATDSRNASERSSSGLIEFENVTEAVEALSVMNHYPIKSSGTSSINADIRNSIMREVHTLE